MSQRSFVRKTTETIGSFGVTLILNLMTGILISRGLGPYDKGVFIALTTWANILLWTFNISLYQVTIYYFNKYPNKRKTVFTTLIITSLVLGIVASVVGEVFLFPFLSSKGLVSDPNVVRLLFLTLPLSTMFQVVSGGLNGTMEFRFTNVVRVVQPLMTVVAWSALILLNKMYTTWCVEWYVCSYTAFNLLGLLYAAKHGLFGRRFSWSILRRGLLYGLKSHGSTTADVVSANLTPLIMSVLLSPTYLGLYSTAQSAAGTLNVFSSAIAVTGFPLLSSLKDSETHRTTMRMWRILLFVTVPILLLMMGLFPFVIPLVFGRAFSSAVLCGCTLLVSVVLSGQAGILRSALNSRGYTLVNSTSEGLALLFSLGGLLLFTHFWGLEGAALSAVLGSFVRLIVIIGSYIRRIEHIRVSELVPGKMDVQYFFSRVSVLAHRTVSRT